MSQTTADQPLSAATEDLAPAALVDAVLAGHRLDAAESLAVLRTADADTLRLVAEAGRVRRRHFGDWVKVNYLVNLKSGLCPEDCFYCSQRLGSDAEILKYTWLKPEDAAEQAALGIRGGASRVCLVASGRGPSDRDVERVTSMVGQIKGEHPAVEVCACLGLLKDGQADRLRAAGVDAYNHNLNTAESNYAEICSSHTYADRVDTVERARSAGLSPCSGLIVGMGESDEQIVEAVLALRELGSDSVPVNFLIPFEGTPLAGTWELTPLRCLRILALARLVCPDKEVRLAGGRELHLRGLQASALEVANSLFLGDYLTSEGQAAKDDLALIADAGFRVLGAQHPDSDRATEAGAQQADGAPGAEGTTVRPATSCCAAGRTEAGCGCDRADASPGSTPRIRRRGAGTDKAPNA